MCSMARDLRRRRVDPDPVAAVVAAVAVVAIQPMIEKPPIQKGMEGNPHYLLTPAGDVENLDIRKSTMESNRSSLQKLWNQRTLWEGVYEKVNPLGRGSKQFQWFWSRLLQWIWWTCLCSDTSSSHKGDTQEETSHPVSNKCQLRESEEASRRPLSYCSAESQHRSRCQSSKLHYIQQNNRQQINPTAIDLKKWKHTEIPL